MKDDIKNMVLMVLVLEVLILLYILFVGIIGSFTGSGCKMRYSLDGSARHMTESLQVTASLRADGNYASTNYSARVVNGQTQHEESFSGNKYGQWMKINAYLPNNTSYDLKIVGTVSLCRAYLTEYNLWSDSNLATDTRGNTYAIPIPRIEETNIEPLTIAYNAQQPGWRNITEIYPGDAVEVILLDDVANSGGGNLDNITIPNIFTYPVANFPNVNCSDGKQQYSPLCGRWSFWNGKQSYVEQCVARYGKYPRCGRVCCDRDAFGTCWSWLTGSGGCYRSCFNNLSNSASLPVKYSSTNKSLFIPAGSDLSPFLSQQCSTSSAGSIAQCQLACTADPNCATDCNTSITNCNTTCSNQRDTCLSPCNTSNTNCLSNCAEGDTNCIASCNNKLTQCQGSCSATFSTCTSKCDTKHTNCATNCNTSSLAQCRNSCDPCVGACDQELGDAAYQSCVNACAAAPAPAASTCSDSDIRVQACIPLNNQQIGTFNSAIGQYKFWFTATDAGGLVWRLSSTNTPSPISGSPKQVLFIDPLADPLPDAKKFTRKIYSAISSSNTTQYLQYGFNDPTGQNLNHTGGYVFQLKQTKCRRVNGNVTTDEGVQNRGQIQYVVTMDDPNVTPPQSYSTLNPNPQGEVQNLNTGDDTFGYLWMRINNGDVVGNLRDYEDSTGQYKVQLYFNTPTGTFSANVLSVLFGFVREKLNDASQMIFSNLICQNFFSYVKAILMIYIIVYGLMFLSGMATISNKDLVIRVVKVGIVAGLINGQTFEWFNTYLFELLTGFTDQMISNMSGYSLVSASNTVSNPFMFLDSLMSKIFFGTTFISQLMGVLGMGLVGLLYFIIICVGVIIFVIVALRSIAIYVMALVAIAFLISLAPFFLTFMLFEKTFYLFENWCNFLFRYMMEPVILMLGVIVLTQLFTLYIDQVLGFSVCWKCAVGFSLPFANMLPFPGLADTPLFCLYWFGPWGIDPSTYQPGMDLISIIGLIIVSFTAYGWAEFAGKISQSLSSANGPGATQMGLSMASEKGQMFLRKFGLDDQTRAQLKHQRKMRREASRNALKQREKDIKQEEKKLGISSKKESLTSKLNSYVSKAQELGNSYGSNPMESLRQPNSSVQSSPSQSNIDNLQQQPSRPEKSDAVKQMQSDILRDNEKGKVNISGPSVDRDLKQAPERPEKSEAVKQMQSDIVKDNQSSKVDSSVPSDPELSKTLDPVKSQSDVVKTQESAKATQNATKSVGADSTKPSRPEKPVVSPERAKVSGDVRKPNETK
jgi:type IV secretion system protein VirB6